MSQWTFPPAAITAGGSQVLTTTVRRQTDGTPIAGWFVRYEVAAGAGTLRGDEAGQVVEVPTDSNGRASIDVTPTGSAGNTTRITAQIVRPERFGGSDAPRLVIANGAITVNWTDGGSDYVPPPDNLDRPVPTYPIPGEGFAPPGNFDQGSIGVPTPAPAVRPPLTRRGAVLELEVYTNDTETEVGKQARFEVVIRNTGDSTATGVVLNDSYDRGLAHLRDPERIAGDRQIAQRHLGGRFLFRISDLRRPRGGSALPKFYRHLQPGCQRSKAGLYSGTTAPVAATGPHRGDQARPAAA